MQLYGALNPGKPVPGFVSILTSLVKNDGIGSIYKGVDAAIGRQLVYGTARIGLHRYISDAMVEYNDGKPINFGMKTLSGMASGSIAVCIGTPFDIALVRLQSDSMAPLEERKNYKNVFDALTRTVKEEGVIALYKGLAPNILRGMSMNVGMMACYDQAKEVVAKMLGDPMEKGPALTTQIGASAVAVSSDVVTLEMCPLLCYRYYTNWLLPLSISSFSGFYRSPVQYAIRSYQISINVTKAKSCYGSTSICWCYGLYYANLKG